MRTRLLSDVMQNRFSSVLKVLRGWRFYKREGTSDHRYSLFNTTSFSCITSHTGKVKRFLCTKLKSAAKYFAYPFAFLKFKFCMVM